MVIEIDRDRFVATMKEQSEIGATDERELHRLALSDADKEIRDWFYTAMEQAGLNVRIDGFGNMFGRRKGTDPDADPVLIGSHLDSQPYGGIYDGALGVIAALETIRSLNDTDIETTRPIEIVNWTNEEGSRFQPAMQGSGVWAGVHDIEDEYAKMDEDGNVFEDELERIGYKGDHPAAPATEYRACLELHIEQGPYLELEENEVGIVTGVVGFYWGAITFDGEANHSGTTPMHFRNDALVAASDVITQVRRIAGTVGNHTVGTVGYVDTKPNSINTIPGEVTITFGYRDPSDEIVEDAKDLTLKQAEAAAEQEGISWEWQKRHDSESVEFSEKCIQTVERATTDLGYDGMRIFSGAGHDAVHITDVCDTSMIFAVSEDGKSHSNKEYTNWDDCYTASNTLANATLDLAEPRQ